MNLQKEKERVENELQMLRQQISQIEQTRGQILENLIKKQGQLELLINLLGKPTEE